jgi:hypothetical protein
MRKLYSFISILILSTNLFAQDIYTIFGYRITNLEQNGAHRASLSTYLWDNSMVVTDEVIGNNKFDYMKHENGYFAGLGYRQMNMFNNPNLYSNYSFKFQEENVSIFVTDNSSWSNDTGWQKIYGQSLIFGYGLGYMMDNGLSFEASADYNLPLGQTVWNDFDDFPTGNFLSFNLKAGYTIGSGRDNLWTAPLGVHISQPTNTRFMNSEVFDSVNPSSRDIEFELPGGYGLVAGVAVMIAGLFADDGYSGYDSTSYEWDQFYNSYGVLVYRCRTDGGPNSGQFAPNSKCSGFKNDDRWPSKRAL